MSAFKHRRAQMEQPECEACGSDQVVIDTKEGHMVCSDCGVIMRQSMISSNSEYRNFSETDKPTGAALLRRLPASWHLLQHSEHHKHQTHG